MRVYYFGCHGQAGHYMHKPNMQTDWEFCRSNPWGYSIDGGLLKGKRERYVIAQKDGWTALSFWDNTVDKRPGSHSTFLAEGDFTLARMFEIVREHFPKIAARVSLPAHPSAGEPQPHGKEKA